MKVLVLHVEICLESDPFSPPALWCPDHGPPGPLQWLLTSSHAPITSAQHSRQRSPARAWVSSCHSLRCTAPGVLSVTMRLCLSGPRWPYLSFTCSRHTARQSWQSRHTSAPGPLHLLFPLPAMLFPQAHAWHICLLPSSPLQIPSSQWGSPGCHPRIAISSSYASFFYSPSCFTFLFSTFSL